MNVKNFHAEVSQDILKVNCWTRAFIVRFEQW